VIIQCDSGHLIGDLIACARHHIYDLRTKADDGQITHVLFIIHLPRQVPQSSFVGFQGDPWISAHVDDLRPNSNNTVSANDAFGASFSELFIGKKQVKQISHLKDVQRFDSITDQISEEGENEHFDDHGESSDSEMSSSGGQSTDDMIVEEIEDGNLDDHDESIDIEVASLGQSAEDRGSDDMIVEDIEDEVFPQPLLPGPTWDATTDIGLQTRGMMREETQFTIVGSPLYRRLHGCIQAAASKLNDIAAKRCTKRVEILIHLIPRDPPNLPGYCCTVHIDGMLCVCAGLTLVSNHFR